MAKWSAKPSGNEEYLTSGRWKCEKSPSGAHHWIILQNEMTCRYCECSKQVVPGGTGHSASAPKPDAGKLVAD
jgi:hypothetical protein